MCTLESGSGLSTRRRILRKRPPLPGEEPSRKIPRGAGKDQIRALVINLDRRPDRWEAVQSRLAPLERGGSIRCERLRANDGASDEIPENAVGHEWTTDRNAMYDGRKGYRKGIKLKMTPGERGCAMSHIHAWRRVASTDSGTKVSDAVTSNAQVQKPTLILEDDVVLVKGFEKRLSKALAALPSDSGVDVLYLAYIEGAPWRRKVVRNIFEAEYLWTTAAYLLWPHGARRLLSMLPVDCPIDNFMAWQMSTRRLTAFAIHPALADQELEWDEGSDVKHSDDAVLDGLV